MNPPQKPHPVIANLRQRLVTGKKDNLKIAIIVEGGTMRAATTAGYLVGLERLGLTDCFDAVYANSAGAINACYFLAKKMELGATAYYRYLSGSLLRDILLVKRFLRLDFLFNEVIGKDLRLDLGTIDTQSFFYISTSDATTGASRIFPYQDMDPQERTLALRATCTVPFWGGKPVTIRNAHYVDGLVSNPLPVLSAIEAGFTDILVLFSYPFDGAPRATARPLQAFEQLLFASWPSEFRNALLCRNDVYNRNASEAFRLTNNVHAPRLFSLVPLKHESLGIGTADPSRIREAIRRAAHQALSLFGQNSI